MKDRCERDRKAALRRSKPRDKRREWELRIARKYGLTPHDVAIKWDFQYGRCALCEEPLDSKRVWVIDHDHKTGKFRGLLHAWCNHRVLSMIERGGETRAVNAIAYLGWGDDLFI